MFKNKSGRWLTKALFIEYGGNLFTLKDQEIESEGNKYPSLKQLYLKYNDPTEYEFASKELGGWAHWQELLKCPDIANQISSWREELTARIKSDCVRSIYVAATEEGSFQASKYLAEEGWNKKTGAGRPKKVKPDTNNTHDFSSDLDKING